MRFSLLALSPAPSCNPCSCRGSCLCPARNRCQTSSNVCTGIARPESSATWVRCRGRSSPRSVSEVGSFFVLFFALLAEEYPLRLVLLVGAEVEPRPAREQIVVRVVAFCQYAATHGFPTSSSFSSINQNPNGNTRRRSRSYFSVACSKVILVFGCLM